MRSRPVKRLEDTSRLRRAQFPEDAGAMRCAMAQCPRPAFTSRRAPAMLLSRSSLAGTPLRALLPLWLRRPAGICCLACLCPPGDRQVRTQNGCEHCSPQAGHRVQLLTTPCPRRLPGQAGQLVRVKLRPCLQLVQRHLPGLAGSCNQATAAEVWLYAAAQMWQMSLYQLPAWPEVTPHQPPSLPGCTSGRPCGRQCVFGHHNRASLRHSRGGGERGRLPFPAQQAATWQALSMLSAASSKLCSMPNCADPVLQWVVAL